MSTASEPERADSAWPAAAGIDVDARSEPELAKTLLAFGDLRYRDRFWPRRRYEDACDRIAIRAFLPTGGGQLLEVGAGFGRLAGEYGAYRSVVLLDASEVLLGAAEEQLGSDPRYSFVVGDAWRLPFADGSFDAALCIRVLHHMRDPRPALQELGRVVRPGGVVIVEFANKRNLKAVAGYLLGASPWSPLKRGSRAYIGSPIVPAPLRLRGSDGPASGALPHSHANDWDSPTSYVHSPVDIRAWLRAAGLRQDGVRSVGLFRLPMVTNRVPTQLLTILERLQQVALAPVTAGPSIFVRATRTVATVPSGRGVGPEGAQ